jgi:hypothetical protein
VGKRLLHGLLKGLLAGFAIGTGIQLGLGWVTPALLGGLVAACSGATAGILCGKPPWRQDSSLEALLKALGGVGVGALGFWGLSHLAVPLPFTMGLLDAAAPWTDQPILFAPLIAAAYGAIVELDNAPKSDAGPKSAPKASPKKRPAMDL